MAIQSERGAALLASVPEADRLVTAHVVEDEGRVTSGGDAVAVLADVLPAGAPIAALARALPGPVRGVYGFVAAHRIGISRFVPAGAKARAAGVLAERAP